MAKKIELKSPIEIKSMIKRISVDSIELSTESDGTWKINWSFEIEENEKVTPSGLNISEHHSAGGGITVKRAEIATVASITEDQVRTMLTLYQTEMIVTQIALSKILPIFGSSLANIVV